jgi:SAM-dependent methyltransferase
VGPRPEERAIDVACGPGLLAKAFGPRVRELVGVDLTPAMVERLALHHFPDPAAALREIARVVRPLGRLGVFDMTTSEVEEEARYHNEVERLRDPSHARALPLSELLRLAGLAGFEADHVETVDYELDVEDWIARAEQSEDEASRARARIAAAVGTARFGGKHIRRDPAGALMFTVRWAILVATRREG